MKPGSGWPIGIVAVLATTIGVNLAVMRIAGNDPAFAIEPDYYRKAVAYDSTMAQAESNRVLGWKATASIVATEEGEPQLRIRLVDVSGASIDDATVTAVAMYVARAASPDTVSLRLAGDGEYVGALEKTHAGQWEVRIAAHRATERFTSIARIEAPFIPARVAVGTAR
jgi:nitrogen fixation protein FixH